MSLEQKIVGLAQAIGADVKALRLAQGDLSELTTTAKTSLVAAINELQALIAASGGAHRCAGPRPARLCNHLARVTRIVYDVNDVQFDNSQIRIHSPPLIRKLCWSCAPELSPDWT